MARKGHSDLSLKAQSYLLGIHRSGIYYKPKPGSELNLYLVRLMDEPYGGFVALLPKVQRRRTKEKSGRAEPHGRVT